MATAHVATFGELAVDSFYVKDNYGMKLHSEKRCETVSEALLEILVSPPRGSLFDAALLARDPAAFRFGRCWRCYFG